MRDILGSHPEVAMFPGELPLWRVLGAEWAGRDASRPEVQQRLVRAVLEDPRMRRAGVALEVEAILASLCAEPTVAIGTVFVHVMREYARQVGRARWGLKDPLTEFCVEQILADLPRAAIVHMIRDPRDVVVSQRMMWGRRARHVASMTDLWRRSAELARLRTARGDAAWVAVRYEDLVADPAAVVSKICAALGLAFRPQMLELSARPSWWAISGDPGVRHRRDIFGAAVARHVRALAPADTCFIQRRAGEEMARWGYAPRPIRLGARDRARLALSVGQEVAWRAIRRLRGAGATG